MLLQFASFQAALWVAVGWAELGRQNYKHERWPFISDFHPLQVQIYSFGVMKLTFLFTNRKMIQRFNDQGKMKVKLQYLRWFS